MSTFEKGDRVRVVKLVGPISGDYYHVGAEGVVQSVFTTDVGVLFDKDAKGNKDWWYVFPEELEKINA